MPTRSPRPGRWGRMLLAFGGAVLIIVAVAGAVSMVQSLQDRRPAAEPAAQGSDTLYQVATYDALSTGEYDGLVTIGWLKERGDLGMGTFDGLDGEMVMVDGIVYQVTSTGAVSVAPDASMAPFADVTTFDRDIVQDLASIPSMAALQSALDKLIVRKDAFYAIRVDGLFQHVKVRSVPKQTKPYPELSEALKGQTYFEYENITGTAAGFWSPDYVGGVILPGYHLHFISADRSKAGHLLEASIANAQAGLDETRSLNMVLGP